jgi:heme-degrading monooxygenase HmoA
MVAYAVILKNLKTDDERIVLSKWTSRENAEQARKQWRKVLGGKNWTIDRRPGLDTLDHLALTIEVVREAVA